MKFSSHELKDLAKGWAAISVAFAILLSSELSLGKILTNFFISALTVGISFLLHELGHKYLAQKYNCWAEFRSFDAMLILAIAMSFFGIIFAAPGAVMISGNIGKDKNGKISAMGPLINIALSFVFLVFYLAGILKGIAYYGIYINALLSFFNMLPVWNFDGSKIWKWNKMAYAAMMLSSIFFVVLVSFLLH